jgi:site-specific recombinase XerD
LDVPIAHQLQEIVVLGRRFLSLHGVTRVVGMDQKCRLVDFSRLAPEWVARFKEIWRKHGVYASIETLDAFRYGKINKPLTRSATEESTSP